MLQTIYTIGHSDLSFMRFLSYIQAHNITHIIDIRSIPYSKYAPWSSKSRLGELLRPFHIRYTYLGHKLGGKKQSLVAYAKQQGVTPQAMFDDAIQKLLQLSMRCNLVLLCAEADPAHCHRQNIIAQTLLDADVLVLHILKNGALKKAWREINPSKQLQTA